MSDSTAVLGCSHNPKMVKKIGLIFGEPCEVLVCESCRHDSDFVGFKEEVLEN